MAHRKQKGNPSAMISMPVVNSNAAGIDAGSRSHYVCMAQDNVKAFKTHCWFTPDLQASIMTERQN